MKIRELKKRQEARKKAYEEWRKLLAEGRYREAFSKAVVSGRLTTDMVNDAKVLLTLLGVPWVQAPSEGEAQAAYMALKGDVWATAS
ncbi:MAG TPA: flap structure-specific endonuclease, partial [Thermoprotei archaeon]|nr:flap structure-specific endonuclease [Thermoprotei archaeon]